MKNIFYLTFKDIRKNIGFIFILYLQITVSVVVIAMSLAQLPQCVDLKNHLNLLESKKAVSFESFFNDSDVKPAMPESVKLKLSEVYDVKKQAFSTTNGYNIDEYPDKSVLIAVGNFTELYPLGGIRNQGETSVLIGSNVKGINIGDSFTFGGDIKETVKVTGRLKKDSFYYHTTFKEPLDNSVVILTSYKNLGKLFGSFFDEELIQNTVFADPGKGDLNEFVGSINKSKIINIIPHTAAALYYENYKSQILSSIFFFAFFIIALIFNLIGVVSNIMNIVERNLKAYAVHYIYGATVNEIAARIIVYIIFILLPPLAVSFSFVNMTGTFSYYGVREPWLYLLLLLAVLTGTVSVYPLKKLRATDLTTLIRRD